MVDPVLNQVTWQEIPEGTDVPMSEAIVGTGPLYTTGLGPCYAIGLYGTTTSGVAQLLLCHADSTMGGGDGETTVRECQQQFGEVEEGSLKIVVISGSSLTTQYRQAAAIADVAFETPAPPGPVEGWNAEVCLMPDGQVNWATFSFDQQAERDRLQN